jgi:hypothetical protein
MDNTLNPRKNVLLKVSLGLLAVSILLCGVLIERRLGSLFGLGNSSGPVGAVTVTPPQRGYAPTINWGGAKR